MNNVQFDANNVGVSKNSRKENLKTGLLIAGGVAITGLSIFAAMRGKRINSLKKQVGSLQKELNATSNLIGENKAGLKLFKSVGENGEEVLTTIDKNGETIKKITSQVQADSHPWWIPITAFPPKEAGKLELIRIEDFKTGETIDKVRSSCTWGRYPQKEIVAESIHQKGGQLTKIERIKGRKNWFNRIFNSPGNSATEVMYMDKQVLPFEESREVITYKPFLERFNITESLNQGYWKA